MKLMAEPISYLALTDEIGGRIKSGRLKPGERLCSLREMASLHGVGVMVVRRCFESLEEQGLLVRRHGSGTFVNPSLPHGASKLVALLTSMKRQDIEDYYEPLFEAVTRRRIVPMVGILQRMADWRQTIRDTMARSPDALLVDLEARHFPLDELLCLTKGVPICFCHRWEWSPAPSGRAVLADYAAAYSEGLRVLRGRGAQPHRVADAP